MRSGSFSGGSSYRDRSGRYEFAETLKLIRQREIDWEALRRLPTPYQTPSITEPGKLKGRENPLQTLLQGFRNANSFLITGQKRVGKTSLVNVLLHEIASTTPEALPVYVPLGFLPIDRDEPNLGEIGRGLTRKIIQAYEERFKEAAGNIVPNDDEYARSFNAAFASFVEGFRRAHPKVRFAIALDDMDELPLALFRGQTGFAFFMALRALINSGISFFLVGSERLPTVVGEHAERLNQVRALQVDYLDSSAVVALVREPTDGLLEWSEEAVQEIGVWSAGNPFFATLVCARVWEQACERKDYWVSRHDVLQVLDDLVQTRTGRESYDHFWSDSGAADLEARRLSAMKSVQVVLALSARQADPLHFVSRLEVIHACTDLTPDAAGTQLDELRNRRVIESDPQHPELVRLRVPLFAYWLKVGGADELRRASADTATTTAPQQPGLVQVGRAELTGEEVFEAASDLVYRGERVGTDAVRAWLAQFGSIEDQRIMLRLLPAVRSNLYTTERLFRALGELHKMAIARGRERGLFAEITDLDAFWRWPQRLKNVLVSFADDPAKSGSTTVHHYRQENKVYADLVGDPEKVAREMARLGGSALLVCVDDFVGTGHAAARGLDRNVFPVLKKHLEKWTRKWQEEIVLVFAAVVGYENGLEHIEKEFGGAVTVICANRLAETQKAFHSQAGIFATDDERLRARELARKIGQKLEPDSDGLGWEGSEGLVVLHDNVPNNTLPILRKNRAGSVWNGKPWKALFPRS